MFRVVCDPNVLVSARLSPRGTPAEMLSVWAEGRFELVVSPLLLTELGGVLDREKFRRWLTIEEARAFVAALRLGATVREDPAIVPGLTPDPGDDYLVALARDVGADRLVSGDAHLTSSGIVTPAVRTPRAFVDELTCGG